jgi:hypothetical protein
MQHKKCIAALAGTAGLAPMAVAQATPLGNSLTQLSPRPTSGGGGVAGGNGVRHCVWVCPRYRTYGFPNHRAGSRHWWRRWTATSALSVRRIQIVSLVESAGAIQASSIAISPRII